MGRALAAAAVLRKGGDLDNRIKTLFDGLKSEPVGLTPQQRQDVLARLRMGESAARIAEAYNVNLAAIRQLAR